MSEEPRLVELEEQPVVEVRASVPMSELPGFMSRAYGLLESYTREHGVAVTGPGYGISHGVPGEAIDISAAFPVAAPVEGEGEVRSAALPAGRAATLTVRGPYDEIGAHYQRLLDWVSAQGLVAGETAWEQYVEMAEPGADPSGNLTVLYWALAEA